MYGYNQPGYNTSNVREMLCTDHYYVDIKDTEVVKDGIRSVTQVCENCGRHLLVTEEQGPEPVWTVVREGTKKRAKTSP